MRGTPSGLGTPSPLGATLPAVFQDDAVVMLLADALDQVLAPVFAVLDCLPGYLDPALAPDDFLAWLAGWVGTELDPAWPAARRRAVVAAAAGLHRVRGTVAGLRAHLETATGGRVEITDSGGTAWSPTPTGPAEERAPELTVVVTGGSLDAAAVDALVAAAKPAHVRHHVEVTDAT
ncbi:phage tail protein I [Amycolatopsis sp. OK19-0408]|uniref:Phage tail protein I n=1 Tax=Amycolatopsis iheyensis TaxID=2945988 RepID=A0A9X2NFF2_9PSEU|nr:phage tail protein I [Amycolatopsis iheyensis]MCR6487831.1 phage tail protein I [Amycolatopsis iheyensis]